jgi:hypothetical protein
MQCPVIVLESALYQGDKPSDGSFANHRLIRTSDAARVRPERADRRPAIDLFNAMQIHDAQ